ncbi:hypothetical protein MKL09_31360 [Methylobacterium sp. J-048]|uniref:hypothetical protein n=1 Tax=Methylobacterium sp. J-048 TaxID=2836635 RepID=UPI001FBA4A99|nr:hypothetical protein [Methylobacterium sp. J-048]MCJ2061005.1 hypothetical protein [Methylobacterium sp. J-048]
MADLPDLASVLASTPLERQQIGCFNKTTLDDRQRADQTVQITQPSEAPKD